MRSSLRAREGIGRRALVFGTPIRRQFDDVGEGGSSVGSLIEEDLEWL